MPTATKHNWLGGMNSQLDPTKRNFQEGYYLGINIRTRKGVPQSIRGPLDITAGLPDGQIVQGLYTFGTTLLAFVGGQAFFKIDGVGTWQQLAGFQMSQTAPEIDATLIPSSYINFRRTAPATTTQQDNRVVFTNPLAPSPQCLIIMDGVSQPRIIFEDGTSREVNTYSQWAPTDAEYVPIARFPAYINGILYCVGKDGSLPVGKYTQIFRSVTGRPLDFMILINKLGKQISGLESEGGAPALAHRVSYDSVTAMQVVAALSGVFIVSTKNGSWLVEPDYDRTIAAEPTFSNQFLFDVGAVSKNSIVDVLGDTTIVSRTGVRSFNGIQQFRWQGKNAPFSANVNDFIANQEQTVTAAISFNDYAFYALSTSFGPGVLVFDFLQQAFIGIDVYKNVGLIKQFAKVQTGLTEKLYFYTAAGRVFENFAGTVQKAQVFCNELVPSKSSGSHRITQVNLVMSNIETAGYVESFVYSDRVHTYGGALLLAASTSNKVTPTNLPFNTPTAFRQSQDLAYNYINTSSVGWRAMLGVCWDAEASLLEATVETQDNDSYMYNANVINSSTVENYTLVHVSNDGGANAIKARVNVAIQSINPNGVIGSGNHTGNGTHGSINSDIVPFWGVYHESGRFNTTPGVTELGSVNGEPLYQYLRQGPDHYSFKDYGATRVYFLTSGYNSAGLQVEPSNLDKATIELSEQMQWLKSTISRSNARFNIVCWYDAVSSSHPGFTTRLTDIPLRLWGVDLLLTGAGRMYERLTTPDGLTMINNGCGGGGGPLYTGALATNALSRFVKQGTHGFVHIKSNPLRLTVTFQDTSNTVYDTTNL